MKEASGRFVMRIPPSLHARARERARQQQMSLNEYCHRALESYTEVSGAKTKAASSSEELWVNHAKRVVCEQLLSVIVFGSTARGEARSTSDIDLLVVTETAVAIQRKLYESWDEIAASNFVNPHFVHLPPTVDEAGSLWFEVAMDGIVLFEKGRRVSRFLSELRRAVAEGLIERKTAYGHGYWLRHDREATHVQ